ncbi:MAG TPA: Clp protease N-terminal domain-containing protein, partial [Myxococcaceae bacterium]|nr:Clp protease N-terminal domain-containing protein [Myxococcaceae bacterium]
MLVEPKALVRRLSPTALRLLEAAVGRAAASRFYEIVVEHLLLQMAQDESGDTAYLLKHFGVDRLKFAARLEQILSRFKTGNSGRPVFAENLFQWVEDAWLVASVEHGAARLRSGVLLAQFIARPARYTSELIPELDGISNEELKRDLEAILGPSPEGVEVKATGAEALPASGEVQPGANEALKRFAICFTQRAREGKIDPIFGRDREIRQVVD